MRKKFDLIVVLFVLAVCSIAVVLVACSPDKNSDDGSCEHTLVYHAALQATCEQNGNVEYWSCSKCGRNFKDSNANKEFNGVPSIVLTGHSLTHVSAKEATCVDDGNIEYWLCDKCGKMYSDSEAITIIESSDAILLATGAHDWNDNTCLSCGYDEGGSKGLDWSQKDNYYIVNSMGSCVDENLIIPEYYNGLAVRAIADYAFSDNNTIKSLSTSSNSLSIGSYAFYNCSNLSKIIFNNSVKQIDRYAFGECTNLQEIYTTSIESWCNISFFNEKSNPMFYADNLYFDDQILTSNLVIPDGVVSINGYAFYGCTMLSQVTVPNSVTYIGNSAFGGCSKLESICLPFVGSAAKLEENTYKYPFGYIFGIYNYDGTMIETKQIAVDGNGHDHGMVYYLPESLTTVTITVGDILGGAFRYCNRIVNVTLSDGISSISNGAFYECRSLEHITLPDSVRSIGGYAFYGCIRLKNIDIPDGVTEITYMSFYCSGLTSIVLPDSVITIEEKAFAGCNYLGNILLSNNLEVIDKEAFSCCYPLRSLTIPASVNLISYEVFYGCNYLSSVIFENPKDWTVTWSPDVIALSRSDLSNSETAAKYLRNTYLKYKWCRTES